MSEGSIFSQIIEFFRELVASLGDGYLFFGSPWDIFLYIIDITIVAFFFFWIMVFIRQTRAWQLIKGIIIILAAVLACSVLGLQMVSFLFNRLLYVFAILFIILFQPEFRRALETVGLRSTGSIRNFFRGSDDDDNKQMASLIHEISYACKEMCKTYTGALILIERSTKLDELLDQENVVKFDSSVTNSVLQSVFYKGSPMHDGGLLIRDGRIIAARCHVPLSVTMHNLERSGTRHRAAVGASELGDTIAVVVSEERGKASIAVNGTLYEMADEKELEANLSYLLGVGHYVSNRKGIGRVFSRIRKHKKVEVRQAPQSVSVDLEESEGSVQAANNNARSVTEVSGADKVTISLKTQSGEEKSNSQKIGIGERTVFVIISIVLSVGLWMYIQINNNPVVNKTLTVPISYSSTDTPQNIEVSYPIDSVELTVVGRKNTISNLDASDVLVTIDYSSLQEAETGVVDLPLIIEPKDSRVYFRIVQQLPESISVTVYTVN
ncbi:MAG: diadenylate cyclase [Clostridiales bacterium]|nr:diadenylate cyclase [Clostridiales bacterium]